MNTQQPDPALRALYANLVQTLVAALPPPIDSTPEDPESDQEDALTRRNHAAIAVLASLAPADATEARLAVQYVAASAHATYCLSLVQQHPPTSEPAMKLRTQFARFEREALRSRSLLLTIQEQRYEREAANRAAGPTSSRPGRGQGAGGGLATPGGAAASPAQSPPPPTETKPVPPAEVAKPAPPRHSPPALRIIQGGLAS